MKVKDWDEWQSYRKDRGTPPWIKVHRKLLSNEKWAALSDSEKGQIVSIWIVAADNDGDIPDDPKTIRKICQLDDVPNIRKFKELGFFEDDGCRIDANLTPTCQPDEAPESESESEPESEYINASLKKYFPRPDDVDEKVWDLFLQHRKARKSVVNEIVIKGFRREADKAGIILQEAIEIAIERGWTGFKAEWVNNNTKTERLDHAIQVAVDRIKSNRREIKSIGSDSAPVLQRIQSLRQDP